MAAGRPEIADGVRLGELPGHTVPPQPVRARLGESPATELVSLFDIHTRGA